MSIPNNINLYRITHINNLDFILKSKNITCKNHVKYDPNFIGIGDSSLIQNRTTKPIPIDPKGNFSDYVSHYFGKRSPMLYNIQHGYNNVVRRNPEEIIYLVTNFEEVKKNDSKFVFTDGHGYHHLSQFFNHESQLCEVDWKIVNLIRWNDTEDDPDRKRRKQAEFLIYKEVPISMLIAIVVYNKNAKAIVKEKLEDYNIESNIFVKPDWYY